MELPGDLNIDLRNAILFLEDCAFHEWAHKEIVTALRHCGGFESPTDAQPRACTGARDPRTAGLPGA